MLERGQEHGTIVKVLGKKPLFWNDDEAYIFT